MRIVCPNCAATYEVPEQMLATPREVRCARCGQEWAPPPAASPSPPPAPSPAAPSPAAPSPAPSAAAARAVEAAEARAGAAAVLDRPSAPHEDAEITPAFPFADERPEPAPEPSRRTQTAARFAWAGSMLLLVLAGWAAYTWRVPIMQAWPPSERVFAALGLA